jgi:prepilin-type N-terminal cleavage/methylation domain-containing protein
MVRKHRQHRKHLKQEGMTLIEMIIVTVILALAASGISLSLGALSRASLKAGAGKMAAGMRYAYNRAITQGTTVRVHFKMASSVFSIEEARSGVLLTTKKEKLDKRSLGVKGVPIDAADPWEAAQARIAHPDKPSLGASPFAALTTEDGTALKRYTNVSLGAGVLISKLIVPHEPVPRTTGEGAVYFFPGGRSESALIQLGDGRDGVYTLEVRPLTGRTKIYAEAYEKSNVLHDVRDKDEDEDTTSEVKEP